MKNKGITLIALVITIIILIILAGIGINLTLGENGIFNKAKYAKEKTINARAEEDDTMQGYINTIDKISSNSSDDDKFLRDIELQISNITSMGFDMKVNKDFEDATYTYKINDKTEYNLNNNDTITIETLQDNTTYKIEVIIVETNEKMHKATKNVKTKEAVYLYKDGVMAKGVEGFDAYGSFGTKISYSVEGMKIGNYTHGTAIYYRGADKINFSQYNKLYIKLDENNQQTGYIGAFLSANEDLSGTNTYEGEFDISDYDYDYNKSMLKLNINYLTEEAYLYIRQTHIGEVTIGNIWLEK